MCNNAYCIISNISSVSVGIVSGVSITQTNNKNKYLFVFFLALVIIFGIVMLTVCGLPCHICSLSLLTLHGVPEAGVPSLYIFKGG